MSSLCAPSSDTPSRLSLLLALLRLSAVDFRIDGTRASESSLARRLGTEAPLPLAGEGGARREATGG